MGERREHEPEGRAERPVQPEHRMRGNTGKQCPCRRIPEPAAGEALCRPQRRQPEPDEPQWVTRQVNDRLQQLLGEVVRAADERAEGPAPGPPILVAEPSGGRGDGSFEDCGRSAVQGMGERRIGLDQLDPAGGQVDRPEERRGDGQWQDGRADVVAEPRQCQLCGPRPAARRPGCLVDMNRAPRTGDRDRRRQAVRTGPDHDRVDRASPAIRAAPELPHRPPGASRGPVDGWSHSARLVREAPTAVQSACGPAR